MTEKKTILIYTDVQQIGKTDRNLDGKKFNTTCFVSFQ